FDKLGEAIGVSCHGIVIVLENKQPGNVENFRQWRSLSLVVLPYSRVHSTRQGSCDLVEQALLNIPQNA
ncbi:MAG: hypothetical protein V3U07_00905, partial [Nitrospirales bacterium]